MSRNYGSGKEMSALEAKFEAQKIAFGPIMFQAARILRDSGIFEAVRTSRKGITIEQVAEKVQMSIYAVKVLLEAGLAMEAVYVEEDRFHLTKVGWHLLRDDLTRVNMDFTQDVNYLPVFYLEDSLKNGRPEGLKVLGNWPTVYEGLSQLPEKARNSWFAFDHYYSDYSFPQVLEIIFSGNTKTIMDVGGNTGKWTIQCAKHNPDCRVTIVDLPGQLELAKENIKNHGFESQVSYHPANLLNPDDALPIGHDVIWMSQFLDCFSEEEVLSILQRAAAAMTAETRLFILEPIWDHQRFPASAYSLIATSLYFTCVANGNSKMFFSEDLARQVEGAGLKITAEHRDIGICHTLWECRLA